MITFLSVIVVLGIIFMVWATLSKYSSNQWYCDKMGWHLAPKTKGFDGCSMYGVCPRCNRKVLRDSQGNWF